MAYNPPPSAEGNSIVEIDAHRYANVEVWWGRVEDLDAAVPVYYIVCAQTGHETLHMNYFSRREEAQVTYENLRDVAADETENGRVAVAGLDVDRPPEWTTAPKRRRRGDPPPASPASDPVADNGAMADLEDWGRF